MELQNEIDQQKDKYSNMDEEINNKINNFNLTKESMIFKLENEKQAFLAMKNDWDNQKRKLIQETNKAKCYFYLGPKGIVDTASKSRGQNATNHEPARRIGKRL